LFPGAAGATTGEALGAVAGDRGVELEVGVRGAGFDGARGAGLAGARDAGAAGELAAGAAGASALAPPAPPAVET
jgi:hypothetical protein